MHLDFRNVKRKLFILEFGEYDFFKRLQPHGRMEEITFYTERKFFFSLSLSLCKLEKKMGAHFLSYLNFKNSSSDVILAICE
jgi:hypothetical protein